jgi:hypothetical protein
MKRIRTIIGLGALALATLTAAGCASSGGTGSSGSGGSTQAPSSSAPAGQPLPAGSSWTTPQYPSAAAAAKAAGCDTVPSASQSQPWVDSNVNCNMPEENGGWSGEINIAVFMTPDGEQRSIGIARDLADQSGDIYLVTGKGWMATCINLGNACQSVQAKIGGEFAHFTQWNN